MKTDDMEYILVKGYGLGYINKAINYYAIHGFKAKDDYRINEEYSYDFDQNNGKGKGRSEILYKVMM